MRRLLAYLKTAMIRQAQGRRLALGIGLVLMLATDFYGAESTAMDMEPAQTRRFFISVEIPNPLRDRLEEMQKQFPSEKISLQARHQFHVTIAYFPKVTPEQELELGRFLKSYTAQIAKIPLICTGEVAHGSWSRASDPTYHYQESQLQRSEQIRVSLKSGKQLVEFYQAAITFAKSRGILPPDYDRPFFPHITIGVAQADMPVEAISKLGPPHNAFYATKVTLQREETSSQYLVVQEFRLKSRKKQ